MKIDMLSLIQMFMLITFTSAFLIYISYFLKENILRVKLGIFVEVEFKNYAYLEKLTPRQCFSYFKYDIWRYCSLF
ncbi:hypothetical protein SAMN02745196_00846 [Clostridium collagenovorans DSM 3089]|uniref:Uncharacterized protein n=1 Tax=Clostridium collagenovorans DSM 3089 TaxID=1121306 RepID=A0A1M5U4S0_9CLOT|nr:hypothetical protein [Clostridium collagenovorans]SHH58022.1 hypothetical protein SAMN02745196_00846 [Clostridium collagenovorans DSM 3089]